VSVLFRDVEVNGFRMDVRIGATIEIMGESGSIPVEPGEVTCDGGLLTPPSAEPHVHLDAALLGVRAPNRSGTLREGIANWAALRDQLTTADVAERAGHVLGWYEAHGTLRVRTHVDTGSLTAVEALIGVREAWRGRVEVQIVAFPQEGILRAKGRRERWEEAVRLGVDAVGAIPHFECTTEEGWQSVRLAFDLAERHDLRLDFHCDETDDPGSRNLEVVCAETLDRGFGGRVVAGHCTALHSYSNPYAAKVCELVALSGVQVVANPLDNVVLQGRYDNYPRRRGITRVDHLWAAGATVGIGHDSVMDPWYRLGTANLVDAAYMLVHVAQLTSEAEMMRVLRTLWHENHLPFGAPPSIAVGEPGTVVWWPVADPIEVLRLRPQPRVWRAGIPCVATR
jgi:cytosine deaminase